MILRRYLNEQVVATAFAVAGFLTVILMSGRVIKFFERASNGLISIDLLSAVLLYRLPTFLELILPLALFVGLLLALGRMYLDSEMAVLSAAAVGPQRILQWLLPSVLFFMLLTGMMALWLSPTGIQASNRLYAEQAQRNTFDLIQPGRFQSVGGSVLYADVSDDKTTLRDVVLLQSQQDEQGETRRVIVRAQSATRVFDAELGGQAIELTHGSRVMVAAGAADYEQVNFERYRMRYTTADISQAQIDEPSLRSTATLWRAAQQGDAASQAELGWRFSLLLLVPIIAALALPLAKVSPRQGRYLKLLPAIVLYMSYVVLLIACKNVVAKGQLPAYVFALVHVFYGLLALRLLSGRPWLRRSA